MPPVLEKPRGFYPSNDDFRKALRLFFLLYGKIVGQNFKRGRNDLLYNSTVEAFGYLSNEHSIGVMCESLQQDSDLESYYLRSFYDELAFFNWCYGPVFDIDVTLPSDSAFAPQAKSPDRIGDAIEGAETIKSSLSFFIDKAPKWLRRLLDVASELAKLSRLDLPGHD